MVYITGDCHADWSRFSRQNFPDQENMTKDDIVIVCGDFGLWLDSGPEQYALNVLSQRPFTTVFVDGNHENFDRIYSDEFPVVDFHGGKAQQIRPSVYHLMRGYIFNFEGKKFWAFGGAQSYDISDGIVDRDDYKSDDDFYDALYHLRKMNRAVRVNHYSWWKQELPSPEEMEFGRKMLEANGNRVDYVISHCAPQTIASLMGFYAADAETQYFDDIAKNLDFDHWYFGHYHVEQDVYGKYHCHYFKIERIL